MKKFLCTLLCMMLVFTMMPMATGVTFAGKSAEFVVGVVDVINGGNVTHSTGTSWEYNLASNTLYLTGGTIDEGAKGIDYNLPTPLNIVVSSNTTILPSKSKKNCGIYSAQDNVNITINKGASLTIGTLTDADWTTNTSYSLKNGIQAETHNITIKNSGALNIYGDQTGIVGKNINIVNDGRINIYRCGEGDGGGAIVADGGNFTISSSKESDKQNLTIKNAVNIGIAASNTTFTNVNASITSLGKGGIVCKGGTITIDGNSDIEAIGSTVGIDSSNLVINDDLVIMASEATNTSLTEITLASFTDSLGENTYKHVKIAPKTVEESNWSKLAKAMAGENQGTVDGVFTVEGDYVTKKITLLSDIKAGAADSALKVKTIAQSGCNIILDLNGHVLDRGLISADGTATNKDHGSVIEVYGNATITDSNPDKPHDGYVDRNGLWHFGTGEGTATNINGGIITGGTGHYDGDNYYGGGIFINQGTVAIEGGTIAGNTAEFGGGVYNISYGKFTMIRSEISGNTVAYYGGGVYNDSYGEFSMTYSTITDNTANIGGGVYNDAISTMTNSTITGNMSNYGGGVFNGGESNAIFTMIDSKVSGNTANKGGGVYNVLGEFIMTGSEISGNTASECSGGIYNFASMSLSGKIIIKDNTCENATKSQNLATTKPIHIDGALTDSNIKITYVNSDAHSAGILTASYTDNNLGATLNTFFHYDGPSTYYMVLNTDGELEVKENTEPEPTKPSYHGSYFDYEAYKANLEKLEKEEHDKQVAEVKAAIKNTEFKATSTKQTKLNGKKAIKIKWEVVDGTYSLEDFEGFDVFRSTKKNSGYGKTPFFTTTKWTYTNNKDLKKDKTYYYKVRAWKMVDGEKVYTGWSTKAWRTVK